MISNDEVKAIARLARLDISDDAAPDFARDLSRILDFIAQMNAVDTDAVEPLAHPLEPDAPLRADEALENNQRETFQNGAPATENGLYLVPKVID